jgi:hypothetical protein
MSLPRFDEESGMRPVHKTRREKNLGFYRAIS